MAAIGTTRNLTQQFLRYRNEAKRARAADVHPEDRATAKLLGAALGSGAGDIELGGLDGGDGLGGLGGAGGALHSPEAPRWVAAAERIKGDMAVLKDRIHRLREAHARALLVTFDDAGDAGGGAGGRADALTREIQISFRRLDADIRGLCGAAASDGLAAGAASDGGVREQVQRQLARALFTLSADFRREQTRFLNKVEQQRGYEAGSSIGLVEEEKTSAGAAAAAAFGGGGAGGAGGGGGMGSFTQAQLLRAAQAEALVEERDTEIRKVVETIVELAQIMRDLSTLVVEQGTMLDRVDANVTETAMRVEHGVRELVKAERHQRSSRAMTCILALCALIVVFLVIAVVRHA